MRLASKLCGWGIEIVTQQELQEQIERAVTGFNALEGINEKLAESLVGEGFLSYDDLSVIQRDDLMAMSDLTTQQINSIMAQAEQKAPRI